MRTVPLVLHRTLVNALIMPESTLVLSGLVEDGLALLFAGVIILRKRLVFRHLINLVRCRIFGRCCLINFFLMVFSVDMWLVAILQPIVEIVSKLFKEIHVARLTILLVSAYVLLCPGRHILLLVTELRDRFDLIS